MCCHPFLTGEDLTSDKDGGVTRSVITKGEGYSSPNEGASCESKSQSHNMHMHIMLIAMKLIVYYSSLRKYMCKCALGNVFQHIMPWIRPLSCVKLLLLIFDSTIL